MSTYKRSGIPGTDPVRYIEELEAENARLRDEMAHGLVVKMDLRAELARLRQNLKHADEAYARVAAERDRLGEENNRLERWQAMAESVGGDAVNLATENDRLREENNRLNYELGVADYPGKKELVAELSRLREEKEELLEENKDLRAEAKELWDYMPMTEANLIQENARIRAQRDTLLAALQLIRDDPLRPYLAVERAEAAISEVEGEKQ